jgi:PEGA domain
MHMEEKDIGHDKNIDRFQTLELLTTVAGPRPGEKSSDGPEPSLAKAPDHTKTCVCTLTIGLILLLPGVTYGKRNERDWKAGLLLSTSQARHFVMMLHNSHTNGTSSTDISGNVSEEGSINASGTTTSSANTNGYSMPVYRVYQTYVVEGDSEYYIARERLRWRWSKAADAAIGERIKYAAQGRSLYLLDDQGHEHHATIIQRVLRSEVPETQQGENREAPQTVIGPATSKSTGALAKVTIKSSPDGADIVVDGKFVGDTPSTLLLAAGDHLVVINKPGFEPWQRTVSINDGSEITLEGTLEKAK